MKKSNTKKNQKEDPFLQTILDHTHMLVAYMDPKFNFIKVNKAYAKADERKPSFFPGKNHFDLYPNAENEKIFKEVVKSGKPYFAQAKAFEYAEHPERGTSYWDWSLIPIKNRDKSVEGLVLTLANVTERVLSEAKIVRAKQEWERTFDSVPDLIMILDTQYKILRANKAMAKRLGKSPKDLVGSTCYEIVHDAKNPPEFCPHTSLLKDGKEHSREAFEERLGGDLLITVSPVYDSDRTIIGSVHVARDITELKKSEKALQESEKKFRNLADQSPNMIFINIRGKVVYANKKCEEITGYKKKEFYAPDFDFRKLIAPTSQKVISEAFNKHMAGEDVEPYEYELITKDGRTLSVINVPKLITYEGEDAILGIVTDITERVRMEKALRKSEEALRESEETYRAIFENTGAISVIIEEDMTISLVNEEFEKIVGYSKEEVEWKKRWTEFMQPKDLERLRTAHLERRINPESAPRHYELGFINKQGKIIDVFATVDMIPGTRKTVASAIDISVLKQAEKAMRESEQRYRMLAENTVDIIYVLDENLRRTYVSPSVERVLGYTPEEHSKQDREDFYTPESLKVFQATIKERWERLKSGFDKDRPIKLELEALHKDGSSRWLETRAKPIYDAEDNFRGVIGASRDITERKHLEKQIKEAHDELEQKVQLRTKELVMANEQLLKEIEERKRVEESLTEAELRYRTVADFTYDWEYWIDLDGNFLYVSPSSKRITGYKAEDFIKDPTLLKKIIIKEDQQKWIDQHAGPIRDEPHELQFRIRSKNGEERWIEHVCLPVKDEKGNFLGYRASNRNITHRKKIEDELKMKDSAITSSISGIGITDTEGKLVYVNDSLVKMWGYDRADEILGRDLPEFWEGDGIYKTVEALRTRGWRIGEDTGKRKDRSVFPVQFAASVIKDKDGKPMYLLGSFIDISAQKAMEEDLKTKERSLAEAQRIAHLGNWDWNIVTNELYWSDEIYRIFGLAPQEFGATYEAFLDTVHPDDRGMVERSVDEALKDNKPYSIDHRIVLPDGSIRIVHEQAEVMRDDSGQAIHMAGTVQDITEQKKAEEDRRQLREELTHVSRVTTIGTLTGALAHEINQPLTAIMSNTQAALRFLSTEKPNLDELREILSDIVYDTARSSEVIHQLRDFMKKGEIEATSLDINETIQEVIHLTQRDAESRNIAIRFHKGENLPEVMGDKVQLQQVILNLVINGFDSMMYQEAGSRELMIRTDLDKDNQIHVAVCDKGIGIEDKKLEEIFEPFVSTKPEGMGLGLSINRYIINAHNGHMWAENNPDHGATIHLTLPVKAAK